MYQNWEALFRHFLIISFMIPPFAFFSLLIKANYLNHPRLWFYGICVTTALWWQYQQMRWLKLSVLFAVGRVCLLVWAHWSFRMLRKREVGHHQFSFWQLVNVVLYGYGTLKGKPSKILLGHLGSHVSMENSWKIWLFFLQWRFSTFDVEKHKRS